MPRVTLINKTLSYPCVIEWWLFSPVPIYFEDVVRKLVFQLQTEECRLWIIKDGFIDAWSSDTDYICGHIKHIMRHGCVLYWIPPSFFLGFRRTTYLAWIKICQNCGVNKATNSVLGEVINDIDNLTKVIKMWALLHIWLFMLLCMILNPLSPLYYWSWYPYWDHSIS